MSESEGQLVVAAVVVSGGPVDSGAQDIADAIAKGLNKSKVIIGDDGLARVVTR